MQKKINKLFTKIRAQTEPHTDFKNAFKNSHTSLNVNNAQEMGADL